MDSIEIAKALLHGEGVPWRGVPAQQSIEVRGAVVAQEVQVLFQTFLAGILSCEFSTLQSL